MTLHPEFIGARFPLTEPIARHRHSSDATYMKQLILAVCPLHYVLRTYSFKGFNYLKVGIP